MYEHQTYEAILARCLDRVTAAVDKREGSILYDALAPACAELAALYTELETMIDRAFPDTATGEDLDRKAAERAITRKQATPAARRGAFTAADGSPLAVPLGTRFSGAGLNYGVTEQMDAGVCRLTCETAGEDGNTWFGTLLPVDYVPGLAGAELADVLIPGEDRESDDSLRARYFSSFDAQAFGGNMADYKARVKALPGVGGCRVYRTPAGGGSVGLTIIASDWTAPTEVLLNEVQTAVDPTQNSGGGLGLAPIGHAVTVAGVAGQSVAVGLSLVYEPNVTWADVQAAVQAAIQAYFTELARSWESAAALVVRVSQIETRVLGINGILDMSDTTLNGAAANLQMDADRIPVLGGVTDASA